MLKSLIPAIHPHVDPMLFVRTGTVPPPASAFQNTLATRMLHADQSVWSTQTVRLTKHVRETSVLILVLEPVASMRCAKLGTIFQPALVLKVTLEIPSLSVDLYP